MLFSYLNNFVRIMKKSFLKYFLFYVITIALVLVLFKAVTVYGETQLKAPPKISGIYSLEAEAIPDCLKAKKIKLKIEQSGIYLFANLVADAEPNLESKLALDGKLKDKEFSLSGKINRLANCQLSNRANPDYLVTIQGNLESNKILGDISWNNSLKSRFTAKLEVNDGRS
jgi:hypothetical protein